MGGFCPDDFHGTTEADLQQMSWGEDYWLYADSRLGRHDFGTAYQVDRKREYAIHDRAIAQAKCEGLTLHMLPEDEQSARMNVAEMAIRREQVTP